MWEFLTATAKQLSSLDLALTVFGVLIYRLVTMSDDKKRATVQLAIYALTLMAFGALGVRVLLIIKTGG